MKKRMALFAMLLSAISYESSANTIRYGFSYADDYVKMTVDGSVVINESQSGAFDKKVSLDLSPGWHDLSIVYGNRWGSNGLQFCRMDGDVEVNVPLSELRSLDQNNNWIQGLRADYYNLDGTFVTTVFGEGPIDHGWVWPDIAPKYEGNAPVNWAGIYDGWSVFEERLTGQFYVASSVPLPPSALSGIFGLASIIALNKLNGRFRGRR